MVQKRATCESQNILQGNKESYTIRADINCICNNKSAWTLSATLTHLLDIMSTVLSFTYLAIRKYNTQENCYCLWEYLPILTHC